MSYTQERKNTSRVTPHSSAVGRSNMGKIRKEIANSVGRNWDTVITELKQKFKDEKALKDPVKFLDIAVLTLMKNDKIFVRDQFKELKPLAESSCEFYVHPQTKNLEKNTEYAQKRAAINQEKQKKFEAAQASRKILDANFIAIKQIDSQWAILRVEKLNDAQYDAYLKRTVRPEFDRSELFDVYGLKDVYCVETRTLTYQEKLKLKLD